MIPLVTTTVTIERPTSGIDGFEEVTWTTVASAVPARVSGAGATEAHGSGGSQENASATLYVNPGVDVRRQDRITDAKTSDVWYVTGVRTKRGLGLDHIAAGLEFAKGTS